ncbi:MAG: prepilin-type N-terminal cleavage/methylation domain-containing protein [Planctomycetota bacterium]
MKLSPTSSHPARPGAGPRGFSLVEVSFSVLILAVGLASILSIFPLAMKWGRRSMQDSTGSLAARSLVADLEGIYAADGSDAVSGTYTTIIGDVAHLGRGSYYCRYTLDNAATPLNSLFDVNIRVYNLDFSPSALAPLTPAERALAERELVCTLRTYVYDKP